MLLFKRKYFYAFFIPSIFLKPARTNSPRFKTTQKYWPVYSPISRKGKNCVKGNSCKTILVKSHSVHTIIPTYFTKLSKPILLYHAIYIHITWHILHMYIYYIHTYYVCVCVICFGKHCMLICFPHKVNWFKQNQN